jgi:hypothetical protein
VVELIVVGVALVGFLLLVAFAYWKPGPDQGKPGTPPGAREGEGW